jgi:uncharacterized protein (DUF362 family)
VSRKAPSKLIIVCCIAVAMNLGLLLQALAAGPSSAAPPTARPPTARVWIVQDPEATRAFRPDPDKIRALVAQGITNVTGKVSVPEAWRCLVSTQDTVGIKVYSVPGSDSGTRPAVVAAIVEGLIEAGLAPKQIIVWDKQTSDLGEAGFFDLARRYRVRVVGSAQSGYDEGRFYDSALIGNLVWGDLEFGRKGDGVGRKSFVSKLVSREITKIINVTPLLNHNGAGVSGNLFSLAMGSVDNVARFESAASRMAMAIPEIYALPELSDRVVLNIVDALICQYEGGERGLLHYSTMLNQLRLSRDPVALDVLSIRELDRQREAAKAPAVKVSMELYQNASLLELGTSDPDRIAIETIGKATSAATLPPAAETDPAVPLPKSVH